MNKTKIAAFLEKAGLGVVCVLSAAITFWLSLVSMLHTVTVEDIPEGKSIMSSLYYIRQDNESVIYSNDSFFGNIIYLILSVAALYFLAKKLSNIRLRYKVLFIFVWTFLLGTIWVISSQSAPTFDSFQVVSAAEGAAKNDFSIFNNDDHYFKDYSFQLGYVFFLEIIMRAVNAVSKPENPLYLEVLNAFFLSVINVFVLLITDLTVKNKKVTTALTLMLALSFAPLVSCSFIYGIFPGMAFAIAALYCELRYLMDDKFGFGIASVLLIAIAMTIKSNYLIWLIAMCLIAVVMMFKRKKMVLDCILMAVAVILSFSLQPAVKSMYESRSGIDLGDSIPYASWIAMGLCESNSAPGWFNYTHTTQVFHDNNYDADATAEKSKAVIAERLGYFAKNPQYRHDFFYKKLVSQWNETSYESIWNNTVRGQYKEKNSFAAWVCGDGSAKVKKIMDIWTQLLFASFAVGIAVLFIKKNFPAMSLAVIFLGGFFYQLISEGKSQYIVPYIIAMTGIAACGIIFAGDRMSALLTKNNRSSDE
ncbi:MAG: hypothetical protein IJ779_06610 [Ruminococcus sp.]|nr:hypothetical protein [Ruminococcus sp.]